jgi:RNA recognition motif-containing protein
MTAKQKEPYAKKSNEEKAAKAAAATAEEAQQPETPKKSSAKRGADGAEVDKVAAPKAKKSKSEKQSQEDKAKPGEQLPRVEGSRKSKQAESANGLTIFIRNLPWKAEESVLRKDFSECGEIEHIKMPLNEEGKPRGFAFVKFLTQEGCQAALKFDSTEYGGRTIYVINAGENTRGKGKDGTKGKGKSAHSDRDNVLTICIKGLAYSVEEDTVRKDFTECGEIAKMNMPTNEEGTSRGMAFVTFKTQEAFDAAMKFDQTEYAGRTITVGKPLVRGEGEKGKAKNGKDGKGKGKDAQDAKGKGKGKQGKASMSKDDAKIASVPEAADDSDDEDAQ